MQEVEQKTVLGLALDQTLKDGVDFTHDQVRTISSPSSFSVFALNCLPSTVCLSQLFALN